MSIFDGILLASDLDGTLMNKGAVSPENLEAVKYFMDNGGIFTVATGRAPYFIKTLGIPVNAPVISLGGTIIYDMEKEQVLKSYTFPDRYLDIVNKAKEKYSPENVFVYPFDYTENNTKPICKVVFIFDDETKTLRVKQEFEREYSANFAFERSWHLGLEMRSKDGGKGKCLKIIKELTDSRISVAVGDFENDLTMLKAADISFAPASGCEAAIKTATYTTAACANHSIAAIICQLEEKGIY